MFLSSLIKKSKSLIGVGNDVEQGIKEEIITEERAREATVIDADELERRIEDIKYTVYENIRKIKDPEKPSTLEELNVVYEDGVKVYCLRNILIVSVEFTPTVPHCSLATLIGLCIRTKLSRCLPEDVNKFDIFIRKGTHKTEEEINKQINDKERIAAALENPSLYTVVEDCIKDDE